MATFSSGLRRGLPRVAGGDPWPPAGAAPAGDAASAESAPAVDAAAVEPAPGAMRLPARDTDFLILDHARPGTTQTLFPADQIGQHLGPPLSALLREIWGTAGVSSHRNTGQRLLPGLAADVQALVTTVVFDGQPIALLSLISERSIGTTTSPGEQSYREVAAQLMRMAGTGQWPQAGTQPSPRRAS